MLRDALQRIAVIVTVVVALTAAASLTLGALAHARLLKALADGFYVAGAAFLLFSFVLGMRGPIRADYGERDDDLGVSEAEAMRVPVSGGGFGLMGGLGGFMPRAIRRTTAAERKSARKSSLGLFAFGIVLIFIGAGFDPARHPF